MRCKSCGSYAINPHLHGREEGKDLDLCDVCYWRNRAGELSDQRDEVLNIAIRYGCIDGSHHKTWVIDQVIRKLAGNDYDRIVAESCDGEDGPNTYEWDCGIAP